MLSAKKSDFERTEMQKDKTGLELRGVRAVNPVTGGEIPIYISDYVLMSYGTGAIMAVPGHDTRDWAFAKKFNLPIIEVVAGGNVQEAPYTDVETGVMVNSGFLNGMETADAIKEMIRWLGEKELGREKVNYKLRDWVFSRQRYWGEPIPIVNCPKCGYVALPKSELPLELPQVDSYEPTDTGESPIAKMRDWVETTCPHCGGKAERETDTPCRNGPVPPGIFCAIQTHTTSRPLRRRRRFPTGRPLTGITAAWSTPRFICCIPASGIRLYLISASFPQRSRTLSAQATA